MTTGEVPDVLRLMIEYWYNTYHEPGREIPKQIMKAMDIIEAESGLTYDYDTGEWEEEDG